MQSSQFITLVLFTVSVLSPCLPSPIKREEDPREIVKSESDKNEYRAVTLSNNIRCVLVSDRSTDMAAVEIRVAAGYLGENTPGLAHLVEHMVFEGSVEYPDGNYYQTFVKESGGSYNGATWESATTFMFSIRSEAWVKAAVLLASFIGNPLFPKNKFSSAIQAVDSEYKIGIRSDYRSLYAVGLKLSNPENSYKEFSVGSKETLNITEIYEQTLQFHDRFYSANLISIAVVANDTLDRLEKLAEEVFGTMPDRNRKRPQNTALPFPTQDKRYLGKKVYYEMKTNQNLLSFLFPINMKGHVDVHYIRYLLDHEGRGSIYQYLLSRGYATKFGSYVILEDSLTVPLVVYCSLTEKGLSDPFFVVETLFRFLKAACSDGVDVELWRSINLLSELHFRFQDKKEPLKLVSSILDQMGTTNDTRLYLGAPSLLTLDLELENKILSFLNPDNFNIYIGSNSFSSSESTEHGPRLTKMEYFYSSPYLDTNITEVELEVLRKVEVDPDLHLPSPNTFVPTNFEMFEVEEDGGLYPVELVSRDEGEVSVWWLQDREWRQPRLYTSCMLYPARISRTPHTWALESMLSQIYKQVKDLLLYEAWEADFNAEYKIGGSWRIMVHGYSDTAKIESVLREMLGVFFSLDFNMEEELFNATVLQPVEEMFDERGKDSYRFAYKHIDSVVMRNFIDVADVKKVVGTITQQDIREYMINFISDLSLICSTFGNARKEDAIKYSSIIRDKLVEEGSTIKNEDRRGLLDEDTWKLPTGGSHVIRRRMENSEQVASTALVMFQIGREEGRVGDSPPYTLHAFSMLLELIMKQNCFNYLRNEKQLGYMAFCYAENYKGVVNFYFGVQGSRPGAGPDVMDREINYLVSQQYEMFQLLSITPAGLDRFEQAKQALSERVTMKQQTLEDQSSLHMSRIYYPSTDFKKMEKVADAISALTVDTFLELYEIFFVGNSKRKLSAQVYGKSHEITDVMEEGEILIPDVGEFRKKLTETF